MNEKRKLEIQVRRAEIREELKDEEKTKEELEKLKQEAEQLNKEEQKIEEDEKDLKAVEDNPDDQKEIEPPKTEKEEDRKMNQKAEYRKAFLKRMQGKELTDQEKRALTSAKTSVGAAVPEETQNEVIRKVMEKAPLLSEITLLHVAGNVSYAVEDTVNDASFHSEGTDITESADKLVKVLLGGYEVTKLIVISKSVAKMSIDAFEAWLTDMLSDSIALKITNAIINGSGDDEPTGVEEANTWGATNSVTVAKDTALKLTDVTTLIGLLPSGYDRNGKFLMSKKTLFTDFMPLQDDSKNSIVKSEGKDYFIYGYPVMLDDSVTIHEAYLGDFKKYVGNMAEDITVDSQKNLRKNSIDYLGCALFDGKPALGEAFVKLVKATA